MVLRHEEILRSPSVWRPRTPEEAVARKRALGADAVFAAGGTLLRTRWEAGTEAIPRHLIDLGSIEGLSGIWLQDGDLAIGALTALDDCLNDPLLGRHAPIVAQAIRTIAGWSVRNVATIGGNIVSRTGDSLPALLAADASLVWIGEDGERTEKLADWLSEPIPDRARVRLLSQVRIPLGGDDLTANAKRFFAFHKVGRREAFTPSLVTVALCGSLEPDGRLTGIRISAGGGQTVPARLKRAEELLTGRMPDPDALGEVYEQVAADYAPAPDPFAPDMYRKLTAANLVVTELWKLTVAGEAAGGKEGAPCR